jgi:hypothetical protein
MAYTVTVRATFQLLVVNTSDVGNTPMSPTPLAPTATVTVTEAVGTTDSTTVYDALEKVSRTETSAGCSTMLAGSASSTRTSTVLLLTNADAVLYCASLLATAWRRDSECTPSVTASTTAHTVTVCGVDHVDVVKLSDDADSDTSADAAVPAMIDSDTVTVAVGCDSSTTV